MAFWKKSEDPWDIAPDQRRTASEPEEKEPGLLDSLREDWDAMQAARQEKREKLRLPPEKCPWCGEDMEQGFLMSGRGVFWYRGIPTGKARVAQSRRGKYHAGGHRRLFDYLPHGLVLPGL